MLDMGDAAQRQKMVQKMKPHVSNLKRFTYGKHILSKLEKIILHSQNGEIRPTSWTFESYLSFQKTSSEIVDPAHILSVRPVLELL